ncbi:MAG: sulfurtransferase TusA family protein [Acidobacteriota bacterium]
MTKGAPIPNPGSGDALLDCLGLLCPLPVVRAAEALKALAPGQLLEVLADDQGVKADFPAFCRGAGHEWEGFLQEGRAIRSFIRKKR